MKMHGTNVKIIEAQGQVCVTATKRSCFNVSFNIVF